MNEYEIFKKNYSDENYINKNNLLDIFDEDKE